jgi:hypothetical protein
MVTSGFLSAAKTAAVRAKPKHIVKIFFILLSFIVLSCIATGSLQNHFIISGCLLLFKADASVPKNREGIVNAVVI